MTKLQGTLFDDLPGYAGPVTKHPLYGVRRNMNERCNNPKHLGFKDYGLRGIYVCEEWRNSPRAFIAWGLSAGWEPGLQIDRRDNDGPYSPANCRFVTNRENSCNRRNTIRLSDGRAASSAAVANGVLASTFRKRVRLGWTPEQAAGIAPPPPRRFKLLLSDGRAALVVAKANGVPRGTFTARIVHGWTPEQAAGIAPPPQRRQNGGMKQLQTKVRKAK